MRACTSGQDLSKHLSDPCSVFLRYYDSAIDLTKIIHFRGLVATLLYRISRQLYLLNMEDSAKKFSTFSFYFTAMELYYTAEIGVGIKFNHGVSTVSVPGQKWEIIA